MSFDNICKVLAEKYPAHFVKWLIAEELTNIKVLKTELSLEPIRADSVIFIQASNHILHIEFQTLTQSNPGISFRIMDYYVRLKRLYKCPITQVVIFLQETDNEIAFTQEYRDECIIHRYRAIRMWEEDSSLFLGNQGLLPLAPLCRTDSPRKLLSLVSQEVAKISDRETRQNTAAYTEILAGLRFEKGLIRQLLREDIMQESVIYQDILHKGEERAIIRQLNRRFGQINSSLINRITLLPIEKLDTLAEELLDFSTLSDLVAWLEENTSDVK